MELKETEEKIQKKIGRKYKPFDTLSCDRKRRICAKVERVLDFYSRLDRKSIIYLLYQREFGTKEKENEELLQSNIKNFSIHYLHLLGNNASRAAAMLTQKLTLKRASAISRLPESTISWGRSQINQGMLYFEFQEMKVNDVVQKIIQKEEIEWV